jgi:thioredoxin 1
VKGDADEQTTPRPRRDQTNPPRRKTVADVKTLTDATFDSELAGATLPMIVDFWAPWCGPCRMVGPVVEEIAGDHADKVTVGKVNVDENPATASKFGIMSIPTIILFKDGQPAKKVIGARPKADLEREFELA